jgi:hypothetical protein
MELHCRLRLWFIAVAVVGDKCAANCTMQPAVRGEIDGDAADRSSVEAAGIVAVAVSAAATAAGVAVGHLANLAIAGVL